MPHRNRPALFVPDDPGEAPLLEEKLRHPWLQIGPSVWLLYDAHGRRYTIYRRAGLWHWQAPGSVAGDRSRRSERGWPTPSLALSDLERRRKLIAV
jgi:hypothetical protein